MSKCPVDDCGGEMHLHCEQCGLRVDVPNVLAPPSSLKAAMSRLEVARSQQPLGSRFPFSVVKITANGQTVSSLDVGKSIGHVLGVALKHSITESLPTLLNVNAIRHLAGLSMFERLRELVTAALCTTSVRAPRFENIGGGPDCVVDTEAGFAVIMEGEKPSVNATVNFLMAVRDERAKAALRANRRKREVALRNGNFTVHTYRLYRLVDGRYLIDPNGGLVVAVVTGDPDPGDEGDPKSRLMTFAGYALCSYRDPYDVERGLNIALGRAVKHGYSVPAAKCTHSVGAADQFVAELLQGPLTRVWTAGLHEGAKDLSSCPALYLGHEETMAEQPNEWRAKFEATQSVELLSSGRAPMPQHS